MAEKATIARPYAKAAFQSARRHNALDRWSTVLATASSVVQDERVAPLLLNPRVTSEQLSGLIADISGEALDDQSRNFIATLASNRRLALLPDIAAMFEALRAEAENTADVQVVSAVQLNDAQKQRLAAALKTRLKREVRLHCEVDESLLGGAVVRAGDFVIDGSLKARLDRLAVEMSS
jgi:F-type H+-transporting ATPase subunit delta